RTSSTPRSRPATATGSWRRVGGRTPPTWSRTSSVGRSGSSRSPTGSRPEVGARVTALVPRAGLLASVDRLVDDRAERVDDLEAAGEVGLGSVGPPPDAGVDRLGGSGDDGVGLDTRVGDDVDVVLLVLDALGVGAVEASELDPDPVAGVGEVDPDVV